MKLRFEVVEHKNITSDIIHDICILKDENWSYGLSKQFQWIADNISDNDYHILVYSQSLVGYTNLVKREILINDNQPIPILGIGNVCVSNQFKKKGIGSILMNYVSNFLKENEIPGILFCKENLVSFYNKTGWSLIDCSNKNVKIMSSNLDNKNIEEFKLLGQEF